MIAIQLRFVDPSYLTFLRSFDSHVPTKLFRPWLWPVRLEGIDYAIPCTTQICASGLPGYFRCGTVPDRGLNLQYMVPVPQAALLPGLPMSEDLRAELMYYEENRKYIEAEAQILHRLGSSGQMDRHWQRHSCDYKELESVYTHWTPGFDAGHFLYPNKEVQHMPISKNGKPYYTKEQYEQARYTGNALEYAQRQGYDLIPQNGYYKMREHDSMVFTPAGRWFWNSRGVHGGALEFMIYYEGRTITDAVLTLCNDPEYTQGRPQERQVPVSRPAPQVAAPATAAIPKTAFRLPNKADNLRQLFFYLCNDRGLDKTVVKEMIRQERVYQAVFVPKSGKPMYNATFIYRDNNGKAVGAYQRGMFDPPGQIPYKRDVPGSDKQYGWLLASPEAPATEVRVFEGAIDAASDASLYALPMMSDTPWQESPTDRLSLEGLSPQPLENYLQSHPDVRKITLMLDGDNPGRRAAKEIAQIYTARGYQVEDVTPPFGKDWNEVLVSTRQMQAEQTAQPAPSPAPEPEI